VVYVDEYIKIRLSELNDYIDRKVHIYGWIEDKRILGNIIFLTIRDGWGKTQITVKREDKSIYNLALATRRQSIVSIYGRVNKYGDTIEVIPHKYYIVSEAEHPLPIDPTGRTPASLPKLIEYRPLSLRIPVVNAIFKLRGLALKLSREYFNEIGCTEINTPKIISTATEGGADLFKVDYFDKDAYLAQSPQLYKEEMVMGLGMVYEIAQYYRAEKSHTRKHLTEFTSVDFEGAYINYEGAMEVLTGYIKYLLERIPREGKEYYEILKYTPPQAPGDIKTIKYSEAIQIIKKEGKEIRWGDDLDSEALSILAERIGGFYYIIDWPWSLKPFYIMRKGDLSESFDLMYNDLELSSGGTREHRYRELKKNIIEKGLNAETFEYHLRHYKYGMPPHAGFGLGLDRLMLILTGRENIREVVLYPRDPETIVP